jgi:hypothetical protein
MSVNGDLGKGVRSLRYVERLLRKVIMQRRVDVPLLSSLANMSRSVRLTEIAEVSGWLSCSGRRTSLNDTTSKSWIFHDIIMLIIVAGYSRAGTYSYAIPILGGVHRSPYSGSKDTDKQ